MSERKTPYGGGHPPLTLADIAARARALGGSKLGALEAENERLAKQSAERADRIIDLEAEADSLIERGIDAAEEAGNLRQRILDLEADNRELRRLLGGLINVIQRRYAWVGADVEAAMAEAREKLAGEVS